jgi:hypothetical protein
MFQQQNSEKYYFNSDQLHEIEEQLFSRKWWYNYVVIPVKYDVK